MRKAEWLVLLAIGAIALPAWAQKPDIVERMMPDGGTGKIVMPKPEQRDRVVRQLKAARATVAGEKRQRIAFLLALLNEEYEKNRDYLLWVLKGCNFEEGKRNCDDMTPEYLAYLYEHGHPEILAPLMDTATDTHNAAGGEYIGGYLSDLVTKSPDEFLRAVRTLPAGRQKKVCSCAGAADGGGMAPAQLRKVRKELGRRDDPVARRCLDEIVEGSKP